jgi:hypothetical protein
MLAIGSAGLWELLGLHRRTATLDIGLAANLAAGVTVTLMLLAQLGLKAWFDTGPGGSSKQVLLSSAARMPLAEATSAVVRRPTQQRSNAFLARSHQHLRDGRRSRSPLLQDEPVDAVVFGLLDEPISGGPGPDRQVLRLVRVAGEHLDQLTGSQPGHGHGGPGHRQGQGRSP